MASVAKFGKTFREYRKHRIPPLAELLATEEEYVNVLENVVTGYMREYFDEKSDIKVPSNLKEHNGYLIFANIVEIYEWHKFIFFEALKGSENSIRDFSNTFLQNEQHFHMYAKYSNNKAISDYLVNANLDYFDEVRNKLNHQKTIKDLLIAPVQRVTRYRLLLTEIRKYLMKHGLNEDLDTLNEALTMIRNVCNEVDDFITLNCVKNFDGLLSAQGKLLFHDFLLCNHDGKKTNMYVFLFKRLIVFTEKQDTKRKFSSPTYQYRLKIPMNKLRMKESNRKFFLHLVDPNAPDVSIACQAPTKDLHKRWVQTIRQQLLLQMDLVHSLVYPVADENQREILL